MVAKKKNIAKKSSSTKKVLTRKGSAPRNARVKKTSTKK